MAADRMAKARERAAAWREKNRERYRGYLKEWYGEHREEVLERNRERYQQNREKELAKRAAYREANREKINAQKRALYAKKKQQQKNLEGEMIMMEGVELERCPRCGSETGVKVQGRLYVAGCTKMRCRNWLGKQDATTGETAEAAAAGWNELAREQRVELGEQAKGGEGEKVKSSEVEKVKSSEDSEYSDSSDLSTVQPFNPPAEEVVEAEEEAAAEEEEVAEEEAAAEEEDGERSARFWLELDGKWYWLEEGVEGCEGCAFNLAFGQRSLCGAVASEDFAHAATLCKAAEGVWRDNSEE